MKMYRFLASYLISRFKSLAKGVTEEEIVKFLDQNGWILYDTEAMSRDFLNWKASQKKNRLVL